MLVINLFLFYGLPLLVLFLARKQPIRLMALWAGCLQLVVLALRTLVYPLVLSLQWGLDPLEVLSWEYLTDWYHGEGLFMVYFLLSSLAFTALAILAAVVWRKRRETKNGPAGEAFCEEERE